MPCAQTTGNMNFLGIDSGGSQCRALLCDGAGNVLGQGLSGPCNPCVQSAETCFHQLNAAIRGALASKAIGSITAVHLGVAGVGEPSAKSVLDLIADRLFERDRVKVSISHDLKIAHAGGLAGQTGLALVAGTGSACYGVDLQGREILTGGWGDLIDDAGSGSWIGLRALQLSVRQADGRVFGHTLLHGVLQFLKIDLPDQLKARIHLVGLSRDERAKLAPVVFELAQSGDSVAGQIVQEAVQELTLLVQCGLKELSLSETRIVLLGGLNASDYFREWLTTSIQQAGMPGARIVQPCLNAAAGAVLLAMQEFGVDPHESILERMSEALR